MKKKYILVTFLLILLLICGCDHKDEPYDKSKTDPAEETLSPDLESKELSIYTIDYNTYECTPSISVIPMDADVNAKLIVNEVVANFKEDVKIVDIEEQADSVAVSFSKNTAPVKNVSEQMEISMLDCIACSLLDNLDYCNEVYFRCGKDNYVSDNIELAYDEPYISK